MSKRNIIIGVVAVVVVLAAIGAASGGSGNTPAGTVAPATPGVSTAEVTPATSDAPAETPTTATPAGAYKVGDRINLDDEQYFAVVQVDPAFKGDGVFKPDADKLWVATLVEIEGINPNGASYNPFYFKIRDGEGFEYNFSAFGKEPQLQSSNDLKPGQKVKGWVTFEVPKTAKNLTLVYSPGFMAEPVEVALN